MPLHYGSGYPTPYRKNKKRAVQQVLEGNKADCKVSISSIQSHFLKIFKAPLLDANRLPGANYGLPDVASNEALIRNVTADEVIKKIRAMKNTAPGPDGISYPTLLKADPSGAILANIYSASMSLKAVPGSWKGSSTILVQKKNPFQDQQLETNNNDQHYI